MDPHFLRPDFSPLSAAQRLIEILRNLVERKVCFQRQCVPKKIGNIPSPPPPTTVLSMNCKALADEGRGKKKKHMVKRSYIKAFYL